TTILSYTDRHDYLYDADQDPDNSANVLLMYTGESRDKREWTSSLNPHSTQTFNTEHIYPQSFLDDDYREADLHNLR
ncbi:peptidase, partial [Saccharophagus degradans]|nr:peptidase [Saccharophagus degradans]